MYLSLIDQGQIEGVKEQLPALISKYPNNPDILFLAGFCLLMEINHITYTKNY